MAGLALLIAILAVSTSAPLVRAAEPAPALVFATLRVGLAALLLGALAGPRLRLLGRLPTRERVLVVVAGLLLGAHFGVWISSLYFTSTAASVALVATQPIFAGLFGHLLLGDRVRGREVAGIAVAAVGCAVLGGGDWAHSSRAVTGDLLAVAGAVTAAGYLVVGRRMRVAVPLVPYLAAVNAVAALGLFGATLVAGADLTGQAPKAYLAIAACAVLGSLVGHTLLNWSVRRIPTHLVTLAILGEPVGASLLTWGFFAERPPIHAVAGGAVVLVGIGVAFVRRRDESSAPITGAAPD